MRDGIRQVARMKCVGVTGGIADYIMAQQISYRNRTSPKIKYLSLNDTSYTQLNVFNLDAAYLSSRSFKFVLTDSIVQHLKFKNQLL